MSSKTQKKITTRSGRTIKTNNAVKSMKEQRIYQQHSKITIYLHVRRTVKKTKAGAGNPTTLYSIPFCHPTLTDISRKKSWEEIKSSIQGVVNTSEFRAKYGENLALDVDLGIMGWKGKRTANDDPKSTLRGKAVVIIENNEMWVDHFEEFSCKMVHRKKPKKYIIIDLAISVYDQEKERQAQLLQLEKDNERIEKANKRIERAIKKQEEADKRKANKIERAKKKQEEADRKKAKKIERANKKLEEANRKKGMKRNHTSSNCVSPPTTAPKKQKHNSNELLEINKDQASHKKNWVVYDGVNNIKLVSVRQNDDAKCDDEDFKSNGSLDVNELLYSHQEKDDTMDQIITSKHPVTARQRQIDVANFLDRLYNDKESPLFHGFLMQMRNKMDETLNLSSTNTPLYQSLIERQDFPPSEEMLTKLTQSVRQISNTEFDGLIPMLGFFPPIGQHSRTPIELEQWKNTENGRKYFAARRGRNTTTVAYTAPTIVGNNNLTPTSTVIEVAPSAPIVTKRMGKVEIDTGVRVTKVNYCDNPENERFVDINISLFDLMKKAKGWEVYDNDLQERFYEVKKSDGSIFTTYVKEELHDDTLHELITMMKFDGGEPLHINCGIRNKVIRSVIGVNDDMSM